jgi:hypothetical protein
MWQVIASSQKLVRQSQHLELRSLGICTGKRIRNTRVHLVISIRISGEHYTFEHVWRQNLQGVSYSLSHGLGICPAKAVCSLATCSYVNDDLGMRRAIFSNDPR